MQKRGYAILQKSQSLIARYEALIGEASAKLKQLRDTFAFINPVQYRGISRDPLSSYYPDDPAGRREFKKLGLLSNLKAQKRFRQIVGNTYYLDYDCDLLPSLPFAQEVFGLLKRPSDYEIVVLSREASEMEGNLVGYDIGYWGGDNFSLICDTVVMPRWHPPNPDDFAELADHLRILNNHVLFGSWSDAQRFRVYYKQKPWAETETAGKFEIIRVSIPSSAKYLN
jgi:hypothetical protein